MDHRGPETSFTSGENGHKIAFDPRDLSETEERSKQPKLTLMEDVLLLGLKDKQVSAVVFFFFTPAIVKMGLVVWPWGPRGGTTFRVANSSPME